MSAGMLLLIAGLGIAVLLVLIMGLRVQAFVGLLVASLFVAVASGIPVENIAEVIEDGMGGVLGFVAIVVGLGAMIGRMMQVSGGAEQVAHTLLERFGDKRAQLAMGVTGFIVSIPVFFDVGLIILIPLVYGIARTARRSTLYYALPLLAGLAVAHAYVPPTPGPVAVASIVGADLGWVIVFGVLCGLPGLILGGFVYSRFISERIYLEEPAYMRADGAAASTDAGAGAGASRDGGDDEDTARASSGSGARTAVDDRPGDGDGADAPVGANGTEAPSFGLVVAVVLLPLVLILMNTASEAFIGEDTDVARILGFVGHPFTALIAATLLAMYWLGIKQGYDRAQVQEICTAALEPVGLIILVTGAGGVFGAVLVESGVGEALADTLAEFQLPAIALAFVIALGVRIAQGGATVSMVTAASIVAPVVAGSGLSAPQIALIVIAIASGATAMSHVNDSGFWLVNRYLGMDEKQTLQTWTALVTIIGFSGFAVAAVLSFVVP
jgi:Gnt-I system low-affinity gluconate transporter